MPEDSTGGRGFGIKLLQLSTSITGSGVNNGFSMSLINKDIVFEQHEQANFFIEGPGGGLMISPNGNIGMGTALPKQKLHIENGNLLISKTSAHIPASMIFETGNSNRWGIEYQNSVNVNGLNFGNGNNFTPFNSVLFLANNNRVGIGTTDPHALLHLHDSRIISPTGMGSSLPADLTSGERSFRELLRLTTRDTKSIGFTISSEHSHLYFQHHEQGTFSIAGLGGGLTISPNGNIGMGTDIPRQKLHVVDGNILISRTSTRAPGSINGSIVFGSDITSTHNGSWGIEYLNSNEDGYGLNFWKVWSPGENFFNYALFLRDDGNVGIGKKDPQAKLDVAGSFRAESANITGTLSANILNVPNIHISKKLTTQRADIDTIYTKVLTTQSADVTGNLKAGSANITGTVTANALNIDVSLNARYATIDNFIITDHLVANASINTTSLGADIAFIGGTIFAKEVQVALEPDWPDFVFSKDYNLPSLSEVEQFIAKNQHLPNVPSAAAVEANGINLGEMNAILLQKIEELTLYIIQMEKRLSNIEVKKGGE
jgi:cytoskeletal protein CcmA (bactofilin family)